MNKKYYVLDTNILLDDPQSIYKFEDNIVILTEAVIEEIDNFKKGKKDINNNARAVSREINKLREKGKLEDTTLIDGIRINEIDDSYGILKIENNHYNMTLPESWEKSKSDNRIIQVAKFFKESGENVIIISKDINVKIKADIMGITAEDYENTQVDNEYKGRAEIYISENYINQALSNGNKIKIDEIDNIYNELGELSNREFYPNEYLLIHKIEDSNSTLMGIITKDCKEIEFILNEYHPYGITGKNIGQKFAIDAMMRSAEDIPLVILQGGSGTGKDFITLACGLEQTFNGYADYRRILITREVESLGKDIGYLPGTEEEKINPFLRGFMDNLEALVDSNEKERYKNEKELKGKVQYLFDQNIITAEAIAYMRGRSINKQFIIIDEAQNCTVSQMKGILTRIGIDTKIIILGDINQIDNIYLDEKNNGLSWASELMKDSPLACQITLKDGESVRSDLVKDILNRL
jgi:PhoH-like ATPase